MTDADAGNHGISGPASLVQRIKNLTFFTSSCYIIGVMFIHPSQPAGRQNGTDHPLRNIHGRHAPFPVR